MNLNLACFFIICLLGSLGRAESDLDLNDLELIHPSTIRFDPLRNIESPPVELEYSLSKDQKTLSLGPVSFSDENFVIRVSSQSRESSRPHSSENQENRFSLSFEWPEGLIQPTSLEVVNSEETVVGAERIQSSQFFQNQQTTLSIDFSVIQSKITGPVHFCLRQEKDAYFSRLCSKSYLLSQSPGNVSLQPNPTPPTSAWVQVNGRDESNRKSLSVSATEPTHFKARFASGGSFEFESIPNPLHLMDAREIPESGEIEWLGYDKGPRQISRPLPMEKDNSLTKMLGFQSTIKDTRIFWTAKLPRRSPFVYMDGVGGGIFKYRLDSMKIPKSDSRPRFKVSTRPQTYLRTVPLQGTKPLQASLETNQSSVRISDTDATQFTWEFDAPEAGQLNRSYLTMTSDGEKHSFFHEIYRGFPREISTRISMVKAQSEFISLGEFAYGQWFEDFLGFSNGWAKERWGLSAKYFQSLTNPQVNSEERKAPLQVLVADLKVRSTPGVWQWDETVGGILSYQNVSLDQLKAPMLGAGAFWARSMPQSIDQFFNRFPFMRYPKWVDMEFIYYLNSLDSQIQLDSSMSLNFHGKILWTRNLFGEAGFGMKRYAFSSQELKAEINALYFTMGLGLNF